MPTYQISQPNCLSDDDWENIKGTSLCETMFRNRVKVVVDGTGREVEAAGRAITAWLAEHVRKLYYFEDSDDDAAGNVYFEDAAEMIAFTLAHQGEETPAPVPENGQKAGRPVPPHRSGGGIPVKPIPIPQPDGWDWQPSDKWWQCDERDDDLWKPLVARYGDDICARAAQILCGDQDK